MTVMHSKIYFILLAGILSFSSCAQDQFDDINDIPVEAQYVTSLNASVDVDAQTRIDFEDIALSGGSGIKLTWEVGDILVAYQNGVKAAVFRYDGENYVPTGRFTARTNVPLEGDFTLIYTTFPEDQHEYRIDDMRAKIKNSSIVIQGNNNTEHLKDNVLIEADYTLDQKSAVVMKHQMAMLTIIMDRPGGFSPGNESLNQLTVINGDYTYKADVSALNWDEQLRVYIFVDPLGGSRLLTFKMSTTYHHEYWSEPKAYEKQLYTSFEYVAGNRYNAPLTNATGNLFGDPVYFDTITDEPMAGNIWVLNCRYSGYVSDAAWQNLRTSLAKVASDRKITLVFPNLAGMPDNALLNCAQVESVVMPLVTQINANAFKGCTSLKTIDLPKVVQLENYAFSGCKSLSIISLPYLKGIGMNVFEQCSSLTSLVLGTQNTFAMNWVNHPIFGDASLADATNPGQISLQINQYEYNATYNGNIPVVDGLYWRSNGPFKSIQFTSPAN